jgi:hypothetical protein
MEDRTPLWIVIYEHARGVDAWACGTEDMAWQSIGESIMSAIDDGSLREVAKISDLRADIEAAITRHSDWSEIDWQGFAKRYQGIVDWEHFEVRESKLMGSTSGT